MKKNLARQLDELGGIVEFTQSFFDEAGIDPSLRYAVDLCVEELFVNMVRYNRETQRDIQLELAPAGNGVRVTLTDFDVERFDPRSGPAVDVEAPLESREPGGLGLYLVMKMVNSIHYEYADRTSRISFVIDGTTHDV